MCVMKYVCKYRVCELNCDVLLLLPITGRHHREASKHTICAVGIADTLYSYGICLEYLKIMLLLVLLPYLIIYLSLFGGF